MSPSHKGGASVGGADGCERRDLVRHAWLYDHPACVHAAPAVGDEMGAGAGRALLQAPFDGALQHNPAYFNAVDGRKRRSEWIAAGI